MATFGLYHSANKDPMQTFDGDRLILTGDCVSVFTKDTHGDRALAVVRLSEGQTVKLVSK